LEFFEAVMPVISFTHFALEHGDEIDYTNVPSPLHHEQQSPVAALPTRRKVDIERKARLAALAQEFNSREDDLSHPTVPRYKMHRLDIHKHFVIKFNWKLLRGRSRVRFPKTGQILHSVVNGSPPL